MSISQPFSKVFFVVLLLGVVLPAGPALQQPDDGPTVLVERQVYLMGTVCRLATYAESRQVGIDRLESLLHVLEETEQELSTWRPDTTFSLINRQPTGQPFLLSPRLCRLFDQLFYWMKKTERTFDPAIGSLIEAWGLRQGGRIPSPDELAGARQRSGLDLFDFSPECCRITPLGGATLDSGAFGKGEALDRVVKADSSRSLSWLIDLGGQVGVRGAPPGRPGWSIDIAHPLRREEAILTVMLPSGSLATSGGSERDQTVAGIRIGHILDPRSGRPAPFAGSVVVWHEEGLTADVLSTALYVMGPEQGLPWAQNQGLVACYLVPDDQEVELLPTTAFKRRFLNSLQP